MPDGSVRFRLWAPGQDHVGLHLHDAGAILIMEALEDGWFELTTSAANAGSAYQFQLQDGFFVPDPASRLQKDGVHGASIIVDPASYEWRFPEWRGRPWQEAVIYELHTGAFSAMGSFDGIRRHLDHLVDLGVTVIELMPIASFGGQRNWGYDGVLPFAPHRSYGDPATLKALIDAAHERGLMIFLDVVYNHFGPDGNYLGKYAPQFFTSRHQTPWGDAIDFSRPAVRQFFIHNALYWLTEYRFDGLRFDAVHAIADDSPVHILTELAETARRQVGSERLIHLVLENDANIARFLRRNPEGAYYDAQWNDDFHHVGHVLLTGEQDGYYADYASETINRLGRSLTEGFVYQGEASSFRDGETRGEPSKDLPPFAFVNFLQNHDQIGNRAFGDRLAKLASLDAYRAMTAILLLAPEIPLLFMGEEWRETKPFLFFCDFDGDLAEAVRNGRRREFSRFPAFADPESQARIPDPNAIETFQQSMLDWNHRATNEAALDLYRQLLALRHREIMPRLGTTAGPASYRTEHDILLADWQLGTSRLQLVANLTGRSIEHEISAAETRPLYVTHPQNGGTTIPPWYVAWYLHDEDGDTA
ncbi:malto-oligosyltrehalose trehalohydrolase [Dongia soli]|uniref:Malto-oligosyltrehalose trehalohydrolase n=1 Tax=Dongia soli TaxID=600628 RepID=A0ABU5E7N1_9PROT|nr:malto-oligosyltrehalose trehalohydrolase [Dongia soli]MDY0881630.1 malto-oligosyltrehalose trehalohydrolase [Dongia soli]